MKKESPKADAPSMVFLFLCTWLYLAFQADYLKSLQKQIDSLQALKSKLPLTITVYVSPELGKTTLPTSLPGLPGWATIAQKAGRPYKP